MLMILYYNISGIFIRGKVKGINEVALNQVPATPHGDRMTNAYNLYTYHLFIWKLVRGISQNNQAYLAFGFFRPPL